MRSFKLRGIVKGISIAGLFSLTISCAPSPQEELILLTQQVTQLQQGDAAQYLDGEIILIRGKLARAELHLRNRNFKTAKLELDAGRKLLVRALRLYTQRRQEARMEAGRIIRTVAATLDSIQMLVDHLPRRTYVDENRCDIMRLRLQQLQEKGQRIRAHFSRGEYYRVMAQQARFDGAVQAIYTLLREAQNKREFVRPVSEIMGSPLPALQRSRPGSSR